MLQQEQETTARAHKTRVDYHGGESPPSSKGRAERENTREEVKE